MANDISIDLPEDFDQSNSTIQYEDGSKFWIHNKEYHRDNGPAIIYASGTMKWYKYGKLHRLDGPAIIYPD